MISVIVPCYKVGKYLKELVDSVLSQDCPDWELLLVDDGSPDDTGKICDNIASTDSRIKVIHKENGGLSSARNEGIRQAQGEWIVFIDGDDYLNDSTFFSNILITAKKYVSDVICYGIVEVRDSDKTVISRRFATQSRINVLKSEQDKIDYLVRNDDFTISAWSKAYNKSFLIENSLFFDEEMKTGEDFEWTIRLMLVHKKLVGLDGTPYSYRIREDSISTKAADNYMWYARYAAIEKIIDILQNAKLNESQLYPYFLYVAYLYYILLANLNHIPNKKIRNEAFNQVKKYSWLQQYKGTRKVNLSRGMINVFGVRNGARILDLYRRARMRKKGQPLKIRKD
jgi:glycosyltransferase involved in cell wall biosynthesis